MSAYKAADREASVATHSDAFEWSSEGMTMLSPGPREGRTAFAHGAVEVVHGVALQEEYWSDVLEEAVQPLELRDRAGDSARERFRVDYRPESFVRGDDRHADGRVAAYPEPNKIGADMAFFRDRHREADGRREFGLAPKKAVSAVDADYGKDRVVRTCARCKAGLRRGPSCDLGRAAARRMRSLGSLAGSRRGCCALRRRTTAGEYG